jgi:hypothetical protein
VLRRAFARRIDRDEAVRWLPRIAADRIADPNTRPAERVRLQRYTAA